MYEYVDGKVDWMAYNLPVEGEAGPFVGSALSPVPTCLPTNRASELKGRAAEAAEKPFVVVTSAGVVLGALESARLESAGEDARVIDVMELAPGTIRPSVELSALDEEAAGALVTLPDGVLLGALDPAALAGGDSGPEGVEEEFHQVLAAVEEGFGDREPDPEELRGLLRERLRAQGRTEEEAERILAEVQDDRGLPSD